MSDDSMSEHGVSDRSAIAAAIAHEMRLLDPQIRGNGQVVDALLAADFTEIGTTGRRYSREATVSALAKQLAATQTAETFGGRVVAPGLVLVSYDTAGAAGLPVRRSTLWRETPTGWQAVFHQGTPVSE